MGKRTEIGIEKESDLTQHYSKVRKSAMAAPDALTFGGHRAPNLEPKYEATVKDKMVWHAITVQKCFDNYRDGLKGGPQVP